MSAAAASKPLIDWVIIDGFNIRYGEQPSTPIEPAAALRCWNEGTASFTPTATEQMLGILAERKRIGTRR